MRVCVDDQCRRLRYFFKRTYICAFRNEQFCGEYVVHARLQDDVDFLSPKKKQCACTKKAAVEDGQMMTDDHRHSVTKQRASFTPAISIHIEFRRYII